MGVHKWSIWGIMYITLATTNCDQLCNGEQQKCIAVITPEFDNCSLREIPAVPILHCGEGDVCRGDFNVTFVDFQPYSSLNFRGIILHVLRRCYGSSSNIVITTNFIDITQLTPSSITSSNFVFPVLGQIQSTRLYGMHFIPILDIPTAYYITEKHSGREVFKDLVTSCTNMWPLLVICLLLCLIAGFFVWILETWTNKEEFPRAFLVGLFEGFWWSFISATTVGYGDRTPKLFVSRLFSVIWILIGVTVCSMFTASLTSDLTAANSPPTPDIEGAVVGILRHRLYEASLVAKHGGTVVATKATEVIPAVVELIKMLRNKNIDGFVLDSYTYTYATTSLRNLSVNLYNYDKQDGVYFTKNTVRTKQTYDRLSYGMLVREAKDYDFLKEFYEDNKVNLQTCKLLELNELNKLVENPEHDMFLPSGGFFLPSLTSTLIILAIILLFGLFYEVATRKYNQLTLLKADSNASIRT